MTQNENLHSNTHKSSYSKKANVLIIEDHTLSAHIAMRVLNDLYCAVQCAENSTSALSYFQDKKTHAFHLILMDISLPGTDGYILASKIKTTDNFKKRPVPIIALTAHDSASSKNQCLNAGMSAVLVKPLLKTTAREILKAFVPTWNENLGIDHAQLSEQSYALTDLTNDTEKVIDFEYTLELHDNDKHFVQNALRLIMENLTVEITAINLACQAQNWSEARVIIHKLQGSTRYFGLKRLDRICTAFTHILKHDAKDSWKKVFDRMQEEVILVHQAHAFWLKNQQNF